MNGMDMEKQQTGNVSMTFEDFKILSWSFSMNREFNGSEDVRIIPELSSNFDFLEEQKILRVFLKISQTSKDVPYFFEVEAGGIFKFSDSLPPDIMKNFAGVNCAAIIFPYIRETIADMTRRAGFPPLHLQPVNFAKMYGESIAAEINKKDSSDTVERK